MATAAPRKINIQITIPHSGEVKEFVQLLSDLEYAYDNFNAWSLLVDQAKGNSPDPGPYWRSRPQRSIRKIQRADQVVLPEDRLYLSKIEISSPGWAEIFGALIPMETLRKYLQDRHTRRQDKEYRESAEAQRLALENERLRLEVVKEQVDILRNLQIPEDQIRAALSRHIFEPFDRLDRLQNSGLIESAKIIETHGQESSPTKS